MLGLPDRGTLRKGLFLRNKYIGEIMSLNLTYLDEAQNYILRIFLRIEAMEILDCARNFGILFRILTLTQ